MFYVFLYRTYPKILFLTPSFKWFVFPIARMRFAIMVHAGIVPTRVG